MLHEVPCKRWLEVPKHPLPVMPVCMTMLAKLVKASAKDPLHFFLQRIGVIMCYWFQALNKELVKRVHYGALSKG